jgi:hypothetical protein
MSTDMNNDKNLPPDTEAYYETIASQEEIYLEETGEELRAVLTSEDDPSPPQKNSMILAPNLIEREPDCDAGRTMTDANSNPRRVGDSLHDG